MPSKRSSACSTAVPSRDPKRRFHALYDKLTRRDVMWRAWVDVAINQGAPGIDGVRIADIEDGGTEGVRAFLDDLAAEIKAETYRPRPLRRVNIPKPGQRVRPDRSRSPVFGTGWRWQRQSPSWSRSSRQTSCLVPSGSDPSDRHIRPWRLCAPPSTRERPGRSTPTSLTASAASRSTPS